MESSLKAFGRLGKAPKQDKEGNHNNDVKKIQHDSPHPYFEQRRMIACLGHEACMINMSRTVLFKLLTSRSPHSRYVCASRCSPQR